MDLKGSVEFLVGAFQHISEPVIIETLTKCNGNLEEAMDKLFNYVQPVNIPQSSISEHSHSVNTEDEDLKLAMELQKQFEQEGGYYEDNDDARLARELSEQFMQELQPISSPHLDDDEEDERVARELQDSEYLFMNDWTQRLQYEEKVEEPDQLSNINLQEIFQAGIDQSSLNSLLDQIKEHIVPVVEEQFNDMELPEFEDTFDVPKLGEISFGCDSIKLHSFTFPPGDIRLTLENNNIRFIAEQISAELNSFAWAIKQKSFPKINEKGEATASLSGGSVNILLQVVMNASGISLNVASTSVKVGKLNVKVTGNSKKFIYNLIINVVVRLLKTQIEKALSKLIREAINEQGKSILGGVSF